MYNILPPLFEITGAALPLVGCSDLLLSLLQNWLEEVQTLAQIPNLIVNFWTLYLRRLSIKLEKLIVFMRYRSKMTILDRIYLSQIRMRAYSTLTDAVGGRLSELTLFGTDGVLTPHANPQLNSERKLPAFICGAAGR